MHIKLLPIDIPAEEPFKNDSLNRLESAEILTQFIKNLDQPYVIAVDSPWGSGKSTFLKMWQTNLEKKGYKTVYLNVWETDYNDDALVTLIKETELQLKESKLYKNNKKAKKFIEGAKKAGYSLLKNGIPAAIKVATCGILDASEITEDVLSSVGEGIAKDQFASYENAKNSLTSFKNNLENFCNEIIGKDKSPIIFIVDELDRCRPDFAVQVLEKIKHLFSVKNIIFVLGIDKRQIGFSIKTLYGEEMDVVGYLGRFIDFDYHLPEPNIETFIDYTVKRHNLTDFFASRKKYPHLQYEEELIKNALTKIFEKLNFSLRTIEQIISQIVIVIKLTKENQFLYPELLTFLLIIRKVHPDLYKGIITFDLEPRQAIENFKKLLSGKSEDIDYYLLEIIKYLEISRAEVVTNYNPIEKYKEIASGAKSEKERDAALEMIRLIEGGRFIARHNVVDFLVKKIEISQRFE